MKKVLIKIEGMTCAGCSSGLEKYLNKQNGIIKAEVNLVMNNANIEYDEKVIDLDKIDNFVKEAGFKSLGPDNFQIEKNNFKKEKIKLIITIVLGIVIMYLSMAHMVGLKVPYINIENNPILYGIVLAVLSTVIIGLSFKIIINGTRKLIHKMPNMDTLISIGVVTSYIYSIYSLIMSIIVDISYIHSVYFESAAMVIVFTKIGRYIDSKSKIKTKEAITKLMTITPNKAVVIREDEEILVSIDEINKGDIVVCKPGEKIAVDGTVVNGNSHVDESFITGESIPKEKKKGNKVVAGAINIDGYLEYSAEKIGKDSTVSEIVKMVAQAVNSKAPISKFADKVSYYFVPTIILVAIISLIIWIILGETIGFALNIFISVLVIACPCALGLATPIATTIATGTSVKNGILIKNSEILENINKINTVVFDKTGTLTEGSISISKIHRYSDLSENAILQLAGSIEKKSEHPISKAIVDRCNKLSIKLINIDKFEVLSGLGIKAIYEEKEVLIGSKKFMIENGIKINEEDEEKLYLEGNTVIFISVDNLLVSAIGLKDKAKGSAKEIVNRLNKRNIEVLMLTGDNEKAAKIISNETGITNVISNVLPSEKSKKIQEIKNSGKKVMMVGDGINDAPSLVNADIGVSLEDATDIAIDSSDVVIMNNDLMKIDFLFSISKKTLKIVKENLFWAFIYNIIMIPIACGVLKEFDILLNPMYSAIAMTISSITVVLNSLRLKRVKSN